MIETEKKNAEAGGEARITAKMNSLQDDTIIRALYDASRAGVKIDLLVRGFCCLRPGVPEMSENIRVVSILGRFLEHSRIFRFHNDGKPRYFIGSADWMVRNLDYRVEAITPVNDPHAAAKLDEILDAALEAGEHAWELSADGAWIPRQAEGEEFQRRMMRRALQQERR
jgi:polyphosphate kinase